MCRHTGAVTASETDVPEEAAGAPSHQHNDGCIHCGLDLEFEMPSEIPQAAHSTDLVIFAGAGVSTEVPAVFPTTLHASVCAELGLEGDPSFPEAMQAFQDRRGRAALVRDIKARLDYVDSYFSLRRQARKFHRELATMPYLRDVVTTNWDTYFEEECLATPFVSGADFALHGLPGRRVYKIHGSTSTLSTITATEADYKQKLDELRSNVLGGALRQLLATKTVVFVGYSLTDWNFRRLYEALRADMGDFAPRAFVVSPFPSAEADSLGLTHIHTSGVRFLQELKSQMLGHCYLPDRIYEAVAGVEAEALAAHEDVAVQVNHKEYPAIIHCWSYQNGLLDACHRILRRRGSGEYSDRHRVAGMARNYNELTERALEVDRYWDAAYLDGYTNGLVLLLDDEDGDLTTGVPLYFIYGSESAMRSREDLEEALRQSRRRARKARAEAQRLGARAAAGMVITHAPFVPTLADLSRG